MNLKGGEMKHWKETVIKSEEIKWKRPRFKITEDGKSDVVITIPLTAMLEAQAKRAFTEGMLAMLQFHLEAQANDKLIDIPDMVKVFKDCGLPEVAKMLEDKAGALIE